MDSEKVDRLSALSALQIAVLAIAGSTVAAVATLIGLRRIGWVGKSNARGLRCSAAATGGRRPNVGRGSQAL